MSVYLTLHGRRVYHKRSCRYLKDLSDTCIASESQARLQRLGFQPCKLCMKGYETRAESEVLILKDYTVEHPMRYIVDGGLSLINTDIGHWKIVRGDDIYFVYHGNKFPVTWLPILEDSQNYHKQSDVPVSQRRSLCDILHYIYKHDKFRLHEIESSKHLSRSTHAQRKRYNDMKDRRAIFNRCRSLQMLDKLSYEEKKE